MGWVGRGWRWVVVVAALAGCGPKVETGEGAETSEPEGTTTGAGMSTSVGTSAGPGTTVTTVDPSTSVGTTVGTSATDPTATDGGSDGDDTNFIKRVDGGGSTECDTFAQDCPRGEKCMPWANDGGTQWNAWRCSPIDPDMAGAGDPCSVEGSPVSGIDNCDATTMCFGVHAQTQLGTCVLFCSGTFNNPVCDDPATACLIENEGVIALCLPACDPLLQDCDEGDACHPLHDDSAFVCTPAFDASGVGAECDGDLPLDCAAGTTCLPADLLASCDGSEPGCCAAFCDLTIASEGQCDTQAGETCVSWYGEGPPPPWLDSVGACRLPE